PVATVALIRQLLDELTGGGPVGAVPAGVIGLAVAGLLAATVPSLSQYLQNEVGRTVGRQAQSDLYAATARLTGLARLENPAFHDRLRMAESGGPGRPGHGR